MSRYAIAAAFVWAAASGAQAQSPSPAQVAAPVQPQTGEAANPDPWEHLNRFSFGIHQALDKAVLRPVAMAYMHAVPRPLRDGIHNAIGNLGEPVVGINDVFQGRIGQAGLTTARFVTNSTVGIAGLFDVAAKIGAPHHDNGFDLTLGRYHVGSGPYLFIPLLGPSTVRDIVGFGVDGVIDPLHWAKYPYRNTANISRAVVGGVDTRGRIDDQLESLMSDATDPYATFRSVYLQNQQSKINEGGPAAEQPLPEFDEGPTASPAPASPAAPAPVEPPKDAAPAPPAAPAGPSAG